MRTTATEAEISRSIMDYLAAEHVFAIRMNSGTQIVESQGKKRAIHMHAPGTADILAFVRVNKQHSKESQFWPTKAVWLEVKTEKGKQSSVQKSFQEQVESEGHKYVVVRSIDDVIAALK